MGSGAAGKTNVWGVSRTVFVGVLKIVQGIGRLNHGGPDNGLAVYSIALLPILQKLSYCAALFYLYRYRFLYIIFRSQLFVYSLDRLTSSSTRRLSWSFKVMLISR